MWTINRREVCFDRIPMKMKWPVQNYKGYFDREIIILLLNKPRNMLLMFNILLLLFLYNVVLSLYQLITLASGVSDKFPVSFWYSMYLSIFYYYIIYIHSTTVPFRMDRAIHSRRSKYWCILDQIVWWQHRSRQMLPINTWKHHNHNHSAAVVPES